MEDSRASPLTCVQNAALLFQLTQAARQRTSLSLMAVVGIYPISGAGVLLRICFVPGQQTCKGFCEECVAVEVTQLLRAVFHRITKVGKDL